MPADGNLWTPPGNDLDQPVLLDILKAALVRAGAEDWDLEPGEFWCRVMPMAYEVQQQGWKVHVSATPLSAPFVLTRCVAVLVRSRCAFKFARDLSRVEMLVDDHCERGGGGKFITVYPRGDDHFRQVAAELDEATRDLHGPRILSDRPLRPGSLVHYRYGVSGAPSVLTNDGSFASLMTAPDGTTVVDQRQAWFSPPRWAGSPFPGACEPPPVPPAAVQLDGRFIVRRAVQHANKGGVYVATDAQTGAEVIIKHARRHVGASLDGTDIRDQLRHEARMLDVFAPLGISPRKIAVFEQEGDVFLAEELVAGTRLTIWAAEQADQLAVPSRSAAAAVELATGLTGLLATAHSTGLVLRDFTPNNLMVTPQREFRLIDLECVADPGALTTRRWTMAYAAPEQVGAPRFGPAPGQEADLFSLGATLFYLLTGVHPLFTPDVPRQRGLGERLSELVSLMAAAGNVGLAVVAPLICGLMEENPLDRWMLPAARDFLRDRAAENPPVRPGRPGASDSRPPRADGVPEPDLDGLLHDGLAYLTQSMAPGSPRLWESGDFGATTDPCNVQHGAAGVLAVLVRAARTYHDDTGLPGAVRTTAGWIEDRLDAALRVLPGLYFGRSGTAWALHDAAQFLGDAGLAARAVRLAEQMPVTNWANPDIAHGLAGAGLAHMHLWQATGHDDLRTRAMLCAEAVLAAARIRGQETLWPIPATFDSSLAGLEHYGFAHGVAGAGYFLLTAAVADERESFLAAARAAGNTLVLAARCGADDAWWPASAGRDPDQPGWQHWCSGASGVGTFLIRLWHVNGDDRARDLAERAAVTVRTRRWLASNSACHGLAGDGEFLLDMAHYTGQEKYSEWARELACVIYARRVYRDGLAVAYGENPTDVTADFNTGLAGVLGFLLRLRHGGPRWWMTDTLLSPMPLVTNGAAANSQV